MATVRIYDYKILQPEYPLTSKVLALDLRDLLELIGSRASQATWAVSPIKLFDPSLNSFEDYFMVTGQSANQLEEYSRSKSPLNGKILAELAKTSKQVIWGEFAAVLPLQDSIWVTIRAIDSTFYEVSTADPTVLDKIKSTYKDVRVADAPVTSIPIAQVPSN